MKRFLVALFLLSPMPALADVQCTFNENELAIIRQLIEVATGSTKVPSGGIENARIAVYLENKLRTCAPLPPPQAATPPAPSGN